MNKFIIPEFEIIDLIYEGPETLVYHAIKKNANINNSKVINDGSDNGIDQNSNSFILKVSKNGENEFKRKAIFHHEQNILCKLNEHNIEGVVRFFELKEIDEQMVLILEDTGKSLGQHLNEEKKFPIDTFLKYAIHITKTLGEIHQVGIIHKDIKPDNITVSTVNGQELVKIIDFNISSLNSRERDGQINKKTLAGSLHYMSPEQTGRLNRDIDYRSDYYSLGITFYQMLSGTIPFEGKEPMDYIHAHLAITPEPLCKIDPEIPPFLSEIVQKLMAKGADERYQSSRQVLEDLNQFKDKYFGDKQYQELTHAKDDISGNFKIPEKLYGREEELSSLLNCYNEASNGQSRLLLVKGVSGIGKTSLISELQKPIVKSKGLFIKGKYDQFKKDIPYSAIRDAFSQLTKQLMVLKEETFETIKKEINSELGDFVRVITDVIPELLPLLGETKEAEELPPAQAMNRFNYQMSRFFQILARKDTPIVVFIDDLQWADTASLILIRELLRTDNVKYLLFIGAYRDNEVEAKHPLLKVIDELMNVRDEKFLKEISLGPLKEGIITELFIDMFRLPTEEILDIANYFEAKTEGNPFFIHELLKKLYTDELINYLPNEGKWIIETKKIISQEISSNIVEMMVGKLKSLPIQTQAILQLAACLGNEFDLNLLSTISAKPHQYILSELWEAVASNVIFPLGQDYKVVQGKLQQEFYQSEETTTYQKLKISFRFAHDRIQQAAYALIDEKEKSSIHLNIARNMHRQLQGEEKEKYFFDLVNHYNKGHGLITEPNEKNLVKEINTTAAEKAMHSSAFGPSLEFISLVMDKYDDLDIKNNYQRVINYYKIRIKAEYLNSHFAEAESLGLNIIPYCQNRNDKADIYLDLIALCTLTSQDKKATEYALKALRLYGIYEFIFSKKPRFLVVLLWSVFKLRHLDYESLPSSKEITDPDVKKMTAIVSTVAPSAYLYSPELIIIILLRVLVFSLRYGITSDSSFYLSTFGLFLGVFFHKFKRSRILFDTSLKIFERFPTQKSMARLYQVLNYFSFNTIFNIEEVKEFGLKGMIAGLNGGDYTYASFNYTSCAHYHFLMNNSLVESKKLSEKALQLAKELKTKDMEWVSDAILTSISAIRGDIQKNKKEWRAYEDHIIDEVMFKEKMKPTAAIIINNFIIRSLLFKDYKRILQLTSKFPDYIFLQIGSFNPHIYQWTMSLAMMGLSIENKINFFQRVIYIVRNLFYILYNRSYNLYNPNNISSYYYSFWASFYELMGNKKRKHRSLIKAIHFAKRNSQWKNLSVLSEFLARSYFKQGKYALASQYIKLSLVGLSAWGALNNYRELKGEFVDLFESFKNEKIPRSTLKNATFFGNSSDFSIADSNASLTNFTQTSHATMTRSLDNEKDGLDIQSLFKFSQLLAGEIHIEKLFIKLLDVLLKNSGAEKVIIIREINQNLVIDAESSISEKSKLFHQIPIRDALHLSKKIVNIVYKGKEEILLSDASVTEEFHDDPYILRQRPKSILCLPIINKGKLQAILYLENNVSVGAFTEERLMLLRMLTGQLAVSMENAILYENLEDKVRERTKELKKAQMQVVELAHQSGMADIASGVIHNIGNILPKVYLAIDRLSIKNNYKNENYFSLLKSKIQNSLIKDQPLRYEEHNKIIKGIELLSLKIKEEAENITMISSTLKNNIDQITKIVSNQKKFSHTNKIFKSEVQLRNAITEITDKYKELLTGIKVTFQIENIFDERVTLEKHKYLFAVGEIIKNAGEKLSLENIDTKEIDIELIQINDTFITKIKDNGSILTNDHLSQIFHSGFSTKDQHGGMGLHDSYNFIYSMGGTIEIQNQEVDQGVVVTIKLPLSVSEMTNKSAKSAA